MVYQVALAAQDLPLFYGCVMDEKKNRTDGISRKVLRSKELFGEEKLVLIEHEGATYRLMITRQGKLILNK